MALSRSDIEWLLENLKRSPGNGFYKGIADYFADDISSYQSLQQMMAGANSSNIKDIYSQLAGNTQLQDWLTPYQSEQMSNLLAEYNAQHNLTNEAEQLQSLGLSSGNVIQTGGSTAQTGFHNTAEERENRDVQKAGQKIGLAKAFIGLAGGLASAGIYGSARAIVGKAINKTASSAANSALSLRDQAVVSDNKGYEILKRKYGEAYAQRWLARGR